MSETNAPVKGTVVGFVFIHEETQDRREFLNAPAMLEYGNKVVGGGSYFTVILLENGEMKDHEGASGTDKIGEGRVKLFCKCGSSEWFREKPEIPAERRQYDCMNHDDRNGEDVEDLIENYDGRSEREY